jgi:hypothetical protein
MKGDLNINRDNHPFSYYWLIWHKLEFGYYTRPTVRIRPKGRPAEQKPARLDSKA